MIDSIFVRNISKGDFWSMERPSTAGPTGGGGQGFIDIPLGGIDFSQLADFLGITRQRMDDYPSITITVGTIGIGPASQLTFASRGPANRDRYRITNQNLHATGTQRHAAWKVANGFPTLPPGIASSSLIPTALIENLKIIIVKLQSGEYYAGYINVATIPETWPTTTNLSAIFDTATAKIFTSSELCENTIAQNILKAWQKKRNVLLYGPPGTGKTYVMNHLWKALEQNTSIDCLELDTSNQSSPFTLKTIELPFDIPVLNKWVTFHQNYSYENFILGVKPVPNGAAFHLEAHAGTLLDAAISIDSDITGMGENKSAVIFIDELNRGNVSRIFGEFITFMDLDYRKDISDFPLPVPLNNLNNLSPLLTEEIKLLDGSSISLPIPWFFPKDVFIIASMNSVDRAVAPLDSALSRRFHKINIYPDMDALASHFNIDNPYDLSNATSNIKAEEVAWMLLYRINYELASLMGRDFELGQSYLYSLMQFTNDNDRYHELAKIWDNLIFPQLQDRFSNRPDEILKILRLTSMTTPEPDAQYLYKQKNKPFSNDNHSESPWTLKEISLSKAFITSQAEVKYTLKFLAGLST